MAVFALCRPPQTLSSQHNPFTDEWGTVKPLGIVPWRPCFRPPSRPTLPECPRGYPERGDFERVGPKKTLVLMPYLSGPYEGLRY